ARGEAGLCLHDADDRIPAARRRKGEAMVWTIFVILLVLWLLGFFAFKVTSGLIHLILVVAVIVLILGLVRRGP
ncbi:MAG TPA: lmo0937 family membrane protein, partial [Thermoanaerobaculia bacterium]